MTIDYRTGTRFDKLLRSDHASNGVRARAEKSLSDVGRLADLLVQLMATQAALNYEALIEQSGSDLPDKLKAAIGTLADILLELVDDETAELAAGKVGAGGDLRKGGDLQNLRKLHADVFEKLDQINEGLKRIEATPVPGAPGRTYAVSRDRDVPGGAAPDTGDIEKMVAGLSPEEKISLAFKLAQANGRTQL